MEIVLSGDIINSTKVAPRVYLSILEEWMPKFAKKNKHSVFQGDSFQLLIAQPELALLACIELKSALKKIKSLDVRLSIGLGSVEFENEFIEKSNGSAFIRSGRTLETLKDSGQRIMVNSEHHLDFYMNGCLRVAGILMDQWSINSAEMVNERLKTPEDTQEELGKKLGIKQATASRRLNRANWQETKVLMHLFDQYYKDVSHGVID
ncbi:hypothetical protein [Nonlabens antarcticus]|uniref:hypothetical protein n=1 Tax=Nonlabens antarcticus TaxID=392714 RepID=UPI00189158DA|nr:hypothetical protein [Nonlabens antarcticus]